MYLKMSAVSQTTEQTCLLDVLPFEGTNMVSQCCIFEDGAESLGGYLLLAFMQGPSGELLERLARALSGCCRDIHLAVCTMDIRRRVSLSKLSSSALPVQSVSTHR